MTDIRTLKDGEKITEPGFYQIPLDVHHSQPCDGVSVTSGILRKMELETPADVWAFHQLNPNRWMKEETKALALGRAMAAYVEGGMEAVLEAFLVLPEDKPRKPTAAQIKAYEDGKGTDAGALSVEFWAKVDADPRDAITTADIQMISDMGRVLAEDPGACAAMCGLPEITMAWRDERTGLWVLSRPDTVNFDGTVTDYKKVNTSGKPFTQWLVDSRITQHGYDMQLALAAGGMEQLTREWPGMAAIVAQCDAKPHHVILREINEEDLRIGQWRNRRALDRFAECLASNHWPGPGEIVGQYQRPEGQRTALLEQMNVETAL